MESESKLEKERIIRESTIKAAGSEFE